MWFKKRKDKKEQSAEKEVVKEEKTSAQDKEEKLAKKTIKTVTKKKNEEKAVKMNEVAEKEEDAKEAKSKKAIYRVVYSKENNSWQIKKDGAKRVIDSKPTKEEALIRVKELSESQDLNFIVHKKDGKFQKKANIR